MLCLGIRDLRILIKWPILLWKGPLGYCRGVISTEKIIDCTVSTISCFRDIAVRVEFLAREKARDSRVKSIEIKAEVAELASWVGLQSERLDVARWQFPELLELEGLNGDAGFRRYYRINSKPSLLAVSAPVATEDSRAFVAIARYLKTHGVDAPEVLAVDFDRGFLLLEDFGDCLLSRVINVDTVEDHYAAAMKVLLRLQLCQETSIAAIGHDDVFALAQYDSSRLLNEMKLFEQWFIPRLLDYQISDEVQQGLQAIYEVLIDSALQQPAVWVHRDYHSRNLIHRAGMLPGVIDFQDAVHGPLTYDLVSLLRDCYVRWPQDRVRVWALQYRDMAFSAGLLQEVGDEDFLRWFDFMGLQRHLKVLGIFARLWLRDGKPGYLNDLPLVIRYTLEVAAQYPQFEPLVALFHNHLLPLCEQQSWYKNYLTAGDQG